MEEKIPSLPINEVVIKFQGSADVPSDDEKVFNEAYMTGKDVVLKLTAGVRSKSFENNDDGTQNVVYKIKAISCENE